MSAEEAKWVMYTGCDDGHMTYGGACDDPRKHLIVGNVYQVSWRAVHDYYTHLMLMDFPDLKFNSACFEAFDEDVGLPYITAHAPAEDLFIMPSRYQSKLSLRIAHWVMPGLLFVAAFSLLLLIIIRLY